MSLRLISIILFLLTSKVYAQKTVEPFATHNQSPLIHFFGLPNHYGGKVLAKGDFSFGNYLNIANNATSSQLITEAIYLDGEMYRNDIILRYGLLKNLQIELNIPLVRHSTGVMDPIISGWHETFGLPGKAREFMTNFNLTYLYRENENTQILMNESELKFGDIALKFDVPVVNSNKHALSVGTFFKFSTGNKRQLIGSGTNDIGANLSGRIIPKNKEKTFTYFYSAGYMHIGSGALLSDILTKNIVFGSLGSAFSLSKSWVPKIQFDFHSGFYKKSATKQLGRESIQLVLGTDYFISDDLNLSFSFSEDLIVNTSPDFVLQFGVSYKL
ncbi:hypothetical protein DF185_18325 [Marinifilum breve]|uniref:DUF3187 domain-containing protein n=1 Tax=Marinifilum breve TaxID=2184082 RepID=A0A2V3ZVC3_9BACT|nr:DUF3187 family protein [Marinifilum breve]PXX96983.1 hypothetical protein DF185_18325 [Marinifilum breve]